MRIVIVSFILLYGVFSASAFAMSLDDALAHAYRFNPELKAERANLEAVFEQHPQALAGFLPQGSAVYERQWTDESFGNEPEDSFQGNERRLNVSQPLFSGGGNWAAIKRAQQQVEAGIQDYIAAEQLVLNNAVIAYVDVIRTRRVEALSDNNRNVLQEQLDATESRFELGETTRTDVAQAKSRLARAQSDFITAEGERIAAESEFQRIFLMQPPDAMELPDKLPDLPENLDTALRIAEKQNPNLLAAYYNVKASKFTVQERIAPILPSADLVGSVIRRDGVSRIFGGDFESEQLTLNVTIPLYQGGRNYSRVRQAKRQANNARWTMEDIQLRIKDNVTESWQQIMTATADLDANLANVKAASIALDGVKQENEIGSRTTLDVLDAEQELFIANVDLVTAKRNRIVAMYNLLASMGELTAEDMGLNVEYYNPEKQYQDVKYQVVGF